MSDQSEPIDFEQLNLEAEKRKAERIVLRFFDREQATAYVLRGLGFQNWRDHVISGEELLSMGDPAEVRAIVDEMLEEAAVHECVAMPGDSSRLSLFLLLGLLRRRDCSRFLSG